jgi:ABC-type Fe3+-citrate transport system substrate-binding protein
MEIERKLRNIEKSIDDLKMLVLFKDDALYEKKLVSLRGIGKILVSEKEMDEAMKKAKKSLFQGVQKSLCQ